MISIDRTVIPLLYAHQSSNLWQAVRAVKSIRSSSVKARWTGDDGDGVYGLSSVADFAAAFIGALYTAVTEGLFGRMQVVSCNRMREQLSVDKQLKPSEYLIHIRVM